MASALCFTTAVAQSLLTTLKTAIDAGTAAVIEIYGDTIPTDADTAVGAQTKLATLVMNATAFGAVSDNNPGAIMTAATITDDASCDDTDTATWFRLSTQAAGTVILQGSVGTSGTDLVFNTAAFTALSTISITALTLATRETAP